MKKLIILIYLFSASFICLSQERIEFCYETTPDLHNNSILHIQARIVNSTSKNVYFLSESCNDLNSYIKTDSPDVELYTIIHCNATFPRKKMIKANSEYIFKSMLKIKNNSNEIALKLTFVQLNPTTKVNGRFINDIIKENVYQTIELKGQLIISNNQ